MLTERNKTTIPSQQDKAQSLAYLSNLDENSVVWSYDIEDRYLAQKNILTTLKSDLEYHDRILNDMNGLGFVSFYLYWYKHIWLILFN